MTETFSGFLTSLGFPLTNERWSWCASNEKKRQAVFTIWEDSLDRPDRNTIDLSWLNDASRTENGAREFRRVMARVINDDFTAYGILCEAVDPERRPRARKRFERDLLVLNVTEIDGRIIGHIVGTVNGENLRNGSSTVDMLDRKRSAIDDLDIDLAELGVESPERLSRQGQGYVRDRRVRERVIARSGGRCEFCGGLGFLKVDGSRYVETHHIISLAEHGPDTLANVIALCPSHHREAHYGSNRKHLEQAMMEKLASLRKDRRRSQRSARISVDHDGGTAA